MIIPEEYQREFLIYGFRYCLGRHTYASHICQNIILDSWNEISKDDKELIQREIKEAAQMKHGLGHERIDAPGWLLIAEKEI